MATQAAEQMERTAGQELAVELGNQVAGARKVVKQAAHAAARAQVSRVREATKTTKSGRTREKILRAASDLIVERGSTDFQMSEVAARCNMSKGALYYYFPDREAMVEEIFTRVVDDFAALQESVAANARSAEEAIKGLIGVFCETMQDGGLFVTAIASEMLRGGMAVTPEIYSRFDRIAKIVTVQIERAQTEGIVRADVDPDISAVTLCGGILSGAARQIYRDPDGIDADAMADALYEIIIDGIGTEASRGRVA